MVVPHSATTRAHAHTHMVAPVAPGPCMPDHAVCLSSPPALPPLFPLPTDTSPLSSSRGHAAMTSVGCSRAVPGSTGCDTLRLPFAPGPWCMAGVGLSVLGRAETSASHCGQ